MAETILVVDDEIINRLVIATMLKKQGFTVIEAKDGKEALDLAGTELPDMVLLDVMMPVMDGFEVSTKLKADERTSSIPIVLVTALNGSEDVLRGIKCGVDEFITKPVDVNELLVRVRTILKIRALDEYMNNSSALSERVAKLTMELEQDDEHKGCDMDCVVSNIMEVNLANRHDEKGKPRYIYCEFNMEDFSCPPMILSKVKHELVKKKVPSDFGFAKKEGLGILVNGVLLSNWKKVAKSQDEYRSKFPPWVLEECPDIENFLYCESESLKIAFINYPKEIKLFDLTWFRHILHYGTAIISLMGKMSRKEKEYLALMNTMSRIIEIKDEAAGRHQRMCAVAEILCTELSCSEGYSESLKDAIRLFDIGKIIVDQNILIKNRPLNEHEKEIIRKMPEFASVILSDLPRLAVAKEIAIGISENWDGSGYPEGLKGEEIPYSARIVSVLNVYDSLRRTRSYRRGLGHEEALRVMKEGDDRLKQGKFDPRVLESFLRIGDRVRDAYL